MRLRQICLVAEKLDPNLDILTKLLDTSVCYRDPGVAAFGLHNGLFATGGDFIEVVSPLPEVQATAAGRHIARQGDSGYMVLFQCADAQAASDHIRSHGVRVVWEHKGDDKVFANHFHPADMQAAIVSVDSMGEQDWQSAEAYWKWAGPAWGTHQNESATGAIRQLTISAPEPQKLAEHWGKLLQVPAAEQSIELAGATLVFEEADGKPRMTGIGLASGSKGKAAFYQRAERLGLAVLDNRVQFCGMNWELI